MVCWRSNMQTSAGSLAIFDFVSVICLYTPSHHISLKFTLNSTWAILRYLHREQMPQRRTLELRQNVIPFLSHFSFSWGGILPGWFIAFIWVSDSVSVTNKCLEASMTKEGRHSMSRSRDEERRDAAFLRCYRGWEQCQEATIEHQLVPTFKKSQWPVYMVNKRL